jgi:type I restriction enzyme R subunit
VPVGAEREELLIELREPTAGAEKVTISGVTVEIAAETELTLGSGLQLTVTQYIDHAGEQIRTATGKLTTLAELWRDPDTRGALRERLRSHDVDPEILSLLLARPDADEYDLLANTGFQEPIQTREERARALEQADGAFLADYSAPQRKVVEALLDKYRLAGVEEIATAEVFAARPFADEFGGIRSLIGLFGDAASLGDMLRELQSHLYDSEAA